MSRITITKDGRTQRVAPGVARALLEKGYTVVEEAHTSGHPTPAKKKKSTKK